MSLLTYNRSALAVLRVMAALFAFALLATGFVVSAVPARAATQTLEIPVSAMTYTDSYAPNSTMDGRTYTWATMSRFTTFVKFDIPTLAAGQSIVSSTLEIDAWRSAATIPALEVYPTSSTWTPSTLTYSNEPAAGARINEPVLLPLGVRTDVPLTDDSSVVPGRAVSFQLNYKQAAPDVAFLVSSERAPTLRLEIGTTSVSSLASPSQSSGALVVDGVGVSSTPRVFAHYFPPYPVSIDNKSPDVDYYTRNYLDPTGENGKHLAYGGLLRDRPLGRAPLGGDWKGTDLVTEVNQAANAGIDGFFVDILNLSGLNWDRTVALMDAASDSGRAFVVAPQLDVNASAGSASATDVAAKMAQLAAMPSAYRLPTGEFVLSAFKAEGKSVAWWSTVLSTLRNQYGIRTVFMPIFLDANYMDDFASISYAVGNWGVRNPGNTLAGPNYAAQAHALGLKWIAPVSVQDSRPNQYVYWEAANFAQLRASWQRAINDDADYAFLATWNDYSENTSFAPSQAHGYSFLDISAYYSSWFKRGTAPTIARDGIYISHRSQPYDATTTLNHRLMTLQHGDRNPAQNTVEVMTLLTAPATITVKVGTATYTYTAPAGVYAKTYPLQTGTISTTATRNGTTIGTATTGITVTNTPYVQDLQYHADTSRR